MIKIKSITQEIDQYMKSYFTWESYFSGYFSGAVLVAQKNKVLLNKGYGFSNLEHNVTNHSKTKFRIGSITKQYTAVALLHLCQMNNISVHCGIDKYLTNYPNGQSISIHHLLTHTSGIPNLNYFHSMRLHTSIEVLVERFKDLPLLSIPGEQFLYSNAGYILSALIIESISGMSYGEYLRKYLFEPLLMKSTLSTAIGAGNLYSTVEDLYLWDRTIAENKYIFSEGFTRLLFTPYKNDYGYGWFISDEHYSDTNIYKTRIHHAGGVNGFSGEYSRIIEDDLTIIVLSNFDTTPVYTITKRIIEMVLESNS